MHSANQLQQNWLYSPSAFRNGLHPFDSCKSFRYHPRNVHGNDQIRRFRRLVKLVVEATSEATSSSWRQTNGLVNSREIFKVFTPTTMGFVCKCPLNILKPILGFKCVWGTRISFRILSQNSNQGSRKSALKTKSQSISHPTGFTDPEAAN